jgi:hypothetical protein
MNDSADTGERHPGVQRDVANEMNEGFVAKRAKNAEGLAPENERGSDRNETQHEAPLVTAPVPRHQRTRVDVSGIVSFEIEQEKVQAPPDPANDSGK